MFKVQSQDKYKYKQHVRMIIYDCSCNVTCNLFVVQCFFITFFLKKDNHNVKRNQRDVAHLHLHLAKQGDL